MPITRVDKDLDAHTMIVVAEYDAPVERVWRLYAEPRQLERFWGPPTWPATVVDHDLRPGGRVTYFMTGPDGEKFAGYWSILAVDAPAGLEFEDGFGDPDTPADMPVTRTRVTIAATDGGKTRMVLRSGFPSAEAMDQLLAMGMQEGIVAAVGQTDALLAAVAAR